MLRHALVCLVGACGIPELPDRSSPELIEVAPPEDVPPSHVDGDVTCLDGSLGVWQNGDWARVPFPELPNSTADSTPLECLAFDAAGPDAWFILRSGHLCHFDGAFTCNDVSTTVAAPAMYGPDFNDLTITPNYVFISHPQASNETTELWLVPRAGGPGAVTRLPGEGGTNGEIQRLLRGDGDQVVASFEDFGTRIYNPLVIDPDGTMRPIDLGDLADTDENLTVSTNVVPLPGEVQVVVSRNYTTSHCTGEGDHDNRCEYYNWWSEIVVLRDRGTGPAEIGHRGLDSGGARDVVALFGTGVRVDNRLLIDSTAGWLAVP